MIYLNLRGNIGNQMFQYAFARVIQEQNKQPIVLCTKNISKHDKSYRFNLNGCVLNDNVYVDDEFDFPWYINNENIIFKIIRKSCPNFLYNILKKYGVYIFFGRKYVGKPNGDFKNIYIDGYWQCDKYFKDIDEVIKKEFKFKTDIKDENKEFYEKILNSDSVCITIRRGDYVSNNKYKKIFYICDEEYFKKSMNLIKKENKNVKWFVFSDDINWAKENLNFEGETYFESGKDDVFEKLILMSACKNFIISNSTFSWWAQYLSENKEKIVMAPNIWNKKGPKSEIFQDNWRLIKVGENDEC